MNFPPYLEALSRFKVSNGRLRSLGGGFFQYRSTFLYLCTGFRTA
jgi:hypothetical protein